MKNYGLYNYLYNNYFEFKVNGKKLIYNSNDKSFMDDLGTKYYFDITIFIKPEILLGEKKILIKKKPKSGGSNEKK